LTTAFYGVCGLGSFALHESVRQSMSSRSIENRPSKTRRLMAPVGKTEDSVQPKEISGHDLNFNRRFEKLFAKIYFAKIFAKIFISTFGKTFPPKMMPKLLKVLLLCLSVITVARADFEMPTLDNMASILQTLKSSGMLGQFQEKFSRYH
jgi:hypothetical protein